MKKPGYTLAEVLIAIAIIGIIAALLVPLANKYKPDAVKVMYLKTYDTVQEVVLAMANNTRAYPLTDGTYNYSKYPFMNFAGTDVVDPSISANDNAKFCKLLAAGLNTVGDISCSANYITYNTDNDFTPAFKTSNGVQFMVNTFTTHVANDTYTYQSEIYFDVDGTRADKPHCYYNATSCKNPDRFKFWVSADGRVIPADPVGQAYLKTRTNYKFSELTLGDFLPVQWGTFVIPRVNSGDD